MSRDMQIDLAPESNTAHTVKQIDPWEYTTPRRPRILGIGGTMRPCSTTERIVRLALEVAESAGAQTMLFGGSDLDFPHYVGPHVESRDPRVIRFIDAVRHCDGLIVGSPAYHGSISGLLKNALDYTEELRNDSRVYLDGLPMGCICCAGGWQAAVQTLTTLRSIAHALRAWPSPIGVVVNTSLPVFTADQRLSDKSIEHQVQLMAQQVTMFARRNVVRA
ncbi:NADPH-dependent FMN reductase [Caballeronia sp. LZ035]|uniref:NADPH-dependent FMN reductase n=1 Tax=Caballeronia sp. LZ035 TaxID=3038568 RepID=UPI00285E8050|nr:NADPH-dependent FMN reductase [Caballeronia sp. LZ035]MDR5758956.1 NAD(P)H-dependent oxidoreductase [Caballeronia sp. LZ035]